MRLQDKRGETRKGAHARARLSALAIACGALPAAQGFQIGTGIPELSLRFDNTIKLGTIYRLNDADPALAASFRQIPTGAPPPAPPSFAFPQALNFNAGDQNFSNSGFVSERADLFSEIDVLYRKNYGLRVSGTGLYDLKYHESTDAENDPTIGQTPFNQIPGYTRHLSGGRIELLDAFLFGNWQLGDGRKITVRLGQHALQYGESLFFGDNGIARAQGPVDIDKLLSSPNAQFREIIRPVPQISTQLQLSSKLSFGAYYQFASEDDRLPGPGSYFSTTNIPWGGSVQPEFVSFPASAGPIAGNYRLVAGGDQKARNGDQFGVNLKFMLGETDFGLYAAHYHDKDGQLYGEFDIPTKGGRWYFVFPEGVNVYGASFSRTLGVFNFAGEASVRSNSPLRSQNILYAAGSPQPEFATGTTAHANFSWLAAFGPLPFIPESVWLTEFAWNHVLSTKDPDHELDQGRTRDATIVRTIFSPTYRQALPGVDLSFPIGLGYTIQGSSSVTSWNSTGNGDLSVGVDASYLDVWRVSLNYTTYLGSAAPFLNYNPTLTGGAPIYGHGNPLGDRDYISLNVRRTF